MSFSRMMRRRRFTFLKIILVCFAIIGVIFWLYQLNSGKNVSLDPEENTYVFPRFSEKRISKVKIEYKSARPAIPENHENLNAVIPQPIFKEVENNRVQKLGVDFHKNHQPELLNYSVPVMKVTPGLGENGAPVHLSSSEQKLADDEFDKAAFNVYLSDRISVNRSVPDPRNPKCAYEIYDKDLPSASVIIIFTDEIWSALLRTIHSVVNRSPARFLHEIILVDDFSQKDELKYHLRKYINQHFKPNLVKLIRLNERKGLIRARLAGAKLATGDVLVFLDSHCEANAVWLEPLLQRIKESKNAVLCPIIDVIDDKTLEYYATNLEYFQIGGFTWNGHFTWIEIPEWEEKRKKSEIAPTRTPTMAGGLFAIDRNYFWHIGSYDSGMDIWGGENLEMSFRVWMCGGTLEIVPCSHVGHIFRSFHPYTFPGNKDTHGINTVRTVEAWMDNYKKYFYFHRPDLKTVDYGDISERLEFKKKLNCKPFEWYLQEIYPQKFIFHKNVMAYGTLRNPITNLCLDSLNRDEDKNEPIGYFPCKAHSGIVINQLISLTNSGELRKEDNCAEVNEDDTKDELPVIMTKCHGKGDNQKWSHVMGEVFLHEQTGKCLDTRNKKSGDDAFVTECDGGHSQIWWFEHYLRPSLDVH